MHLALVSSYPPQECGIATYTRDLLTNLRAADSSLTVDVIAEHGARRSDLIPVWPCFDRDDDYVAPIARAIDELDPDVVHVQHEYGIFGVDDRFHELLAEVRGQGRAVVVTLHTVHSKLSLDLGCSWRRIRPAKLGFDIEDYQRRVGAGANVVVVHQEVPIRQVLIRQGLDARSLVTVAHGTTLASPPSQRAARGALGIPIGVPVIVAFGYFEPAKNYTVLIEALAHLRVQRPETMLLLGGYMRYADPGLLAHLESGKERAADLGLAGNVVWLDSHVPDDEVATVLAAADVACFAYDEDTRSSSGALHHAVGCGVPIVASRIPKFVEVGEISDELLVDPHSPLAVARVVERLLADSAFRAYICQRVGEFAATTSWPTVAKRHLDVYTRAIGFATQERSAPSRKASFAVELSA